jgi:serine/threonine protein phosphatase PrpC
MDNGNADAPVASEPIGGSSGRPDRSRNKDAFDFAWHGENRRRLISMVVCDGMSTSARGGEAAHLAVATFTRDIGRLIMESTASVEGATLESMLARSVSNTNAAVRGAIPDGQCCLAAAIVDLETRQFAAANVGDSCVSLFSGGRLERLGMLDRGVELVRVDGQAVFRDGMPLLRSGVSQAIGSAGPVNPHVAGSAYGPAEAVLCLATDGISQARLETFLRDGTRPIGPDALAQFCDAAARSSDDDATVLLCELIDNVAGDEVRAAAEYWQLRADQRAVLLSTFEDDGRLDTSVLTSCLTAESDAELAERLVTLLERRPPRLLREVWGRTLTHVARAHPRLVLRLSRVAAVSLMRE